MIYPFKEERELLIVKGGETLTICLQCGTCTTVCPWNLVRDFNVRKIVHQSQIGVLELEKDDMWLCATCGLCMERCPREVKIVDLMIAIRRILADYDIIPNPVTRAILSLRLNGNPWGEPAEKREEWARGLGISKFSKGTEFLLFPCCVTTYDDRAVKVAQALSIILKKCNVNFGILGVMEKCCCESIRKVGGEEVFREIAQANIKTFFENGVTKVITISPHCFHTLKNEYQEFGARFEVIHYTQLLAELLKIGKLKPNKKLNIKVTYHDPCYLGRHNKIYDEPRELLQNIPGLEFIEMPNSRENSLCCGGGGGRMWQETKKEERLSDIRLQQALELGVDVIAVACPYCLINLEESITTLKKEGMIKVKDISEIILEAL